MQKSRECYGCPCYFSNSCSQYSCENQVKFCIKDLIYKSKAKTRIGEQNAESNKARARAFLKKFLDEDDQNEALRDKVRRELVTDAI
jgi:hypothetical protein